MCAYQEVQIRAHSMARSRGIVNELYRQRTREGLCVRRDRDFAEAACQKYQSRLTHEFNDQNSISHQAYPLLR